MNSPFLDIENLTINYNKDIIFKNFHLSIVKEKIIAILGANGTGKSSLLKAIAGLIEPLQGKISLDDTILFEKNKINLPPQERKVGLVFQDFALFPHLDVKENILIGLYKKSQKEKEKALEEITNVLKIENLLTKKIQNLSGGQQQKVALARTLITEPQLLLLDEAFSNLDTQYKKELYPQIKNILEEKKITTILITHSEEEAEIFADATIRLNKNNFFL